MTNQTTCARCNQTFACNVENIKSCHCSTQALTETQRENIAKQWKTCLCGACLREIKQKIQ
ncbi:MAG: hypothetical protein ACI93R_002030 [Flavobacteriales bacterium]|jgi:hypothetical protein